jgi:hypothetical protein
MSIRVLLAAMILVAGLRPLYAADRLQLVWENVEDTDALSGVKTSTVRATVDGPAGLRMVAGAECIDVGMKVYVVAFQDGKEAPLAWQGKNMAMRVRFDDGPVRTLAAEPEEANMASFVFYDPTLMNALIQGPLKGEAGQRTVGEAVTSGDARGAVAAVVGVLQSAALKRNAAGTALEFARASQIGVAVPLQNGDEPVLDLSPGDPVLRAYFKGCLSQK